ncbi:uncharacterized protein LOC129880785 [Solanum dulcamara]|uniref:uncharacterized protein LOC129880785 n=1 Tax=Solanum dulcamara TaxID=45834 RepID=UPI0024850F9D|nr:uncharacterized protein LOC129880785 [Solanum dulcamara]
MFLAIFGVQWVMPGCIELALTSRYEQSSSRANKHYTTSIPSCLFWSICMERNDRRLNDMTNNIKQVNRCFKNHVPMVQEEACSGNVSERTMNFHASELFSIFFYIRTQYVTCFRYLSGVNQSCMIGMDIEDVVRVLDEHRDDLNI